MTKTTTLYEVLYVSTIAPFSPISIVGDIAGKARQANEAQAVTGLLIFDGMHFCQQLEGEQKTVLKLIEKIRNDPRHTDVEIIHNAPLDARRFKRFSLGYTTVDDLDVLEALKNLDGESAVNAFLALLATLDLDA